MEEQTNIVQVYLGFAGAFIAGLIGALARHVYHPEGFSALRLLLDLPFIALVSISAGGLASWLQLPVQAEYALAGTSAYLSSQFVTSVVRSWTKKRLGVNEDGQQEDVSSDN